MSSISSIRNMSLTSSTRHASDVSSNIYRRSTGCSPIPHNSMHSAPVERWAGLTRTVSNWDGLRRDPDLWFENGDCLVYLHSFGQSRRGPSFCVPFSVLKQTKCGSMFSLSYVKTSASPIPESHTPKPLAGTSSIHISPANKVDLFVAAPEFTTREASFTWHITTRNFFAFIFGKPLVGTHLGQALVDLQERMQLFRSGGVDNHRDLLQFADAQGYRDFVDCPDYALAMLYYSEHYRLRDAWIDAFAHCVGMNDRLVRSPEFASQSRLTKALITRAYLEMDLQLDRTTMAIRNFLEDDLSPAYLGLTEATRYHLDRFRTFLHGFYVDKFGYWPPPKGPSFSKALYRSLYFDFKNLYDYLVDFDSTTDLATQKLASGGICVLQNVDSFDKRHGFPPLAHPLPLLPHDLSSGKRVQPQKSQNSLKALPLRSKQSESERRVHYLTARTAIALATNGGNNAISGSPIIQAYARFEWKCAPSLREERVSLADARKVRWLLIYGTLQYLVAALRAPKEVRNSEDPSYPLCCFVTEHSAWQNGVSVSPSTAARSANVINNYLSEPTSEVTSLMTPSTVTIEPDCQTHDYLLHTNKDPDSRPISVENPAPLKFFQPSRTSSILSRRRPSLSSSGSHRSIGSRRNSRRLRSPSHCEVFVQGHEYGLSKTSTTVPSRAASQMASQVASQVASQMASQVASQMASQATSQTVSQAPSQAPSRTPSQAPSRASSYHQSKNASATQRSSRSTLPEGAGPDTSWLRPATPDPISHAHGKRPGDLELDYRNVSEPLRTPVVDSSFMDQLTTTIISYTPEQPSYQSGGASCQDSSLWSERASSESSKSSPREEQTESKISSIQESGLLGGLVPIESARRASTKRRPRFPQSTSTNSPTRRGSFRFNFDKSLSSFSDPVPNSSGLIASQSCIGAAINEPPFAPQQVARVPLAAIKSSHDFSKKETTRPRTNSITCRTTSLSKYVKGISLLQVHPTLATKPKHDMDYFDHVSMPLEARDVHTETSRSGTTHSTSEGIPPPLVTKVTRINKENVKSKPRGIIKGDERKTKKEGWKMLWRR